MHTRELFPLFDWDCLKATLAALSSDDVRGTVDAEELCFIVHGRGAGYEHADVRVSCEVLVQNDLARRYDNNGNPVFEITEYGRMVGRSIVTLPQVTDNPFAIAA